MTDPKLPPETLVQLRLGHINIVQGIIGRLGGYSATVKNFSITLAAAAIAVNLAEDQKGLLGIAIMAVGLLIVIDAYYLSQERAFRDLYNEIVGRPLSEAADLRVDRHNLEPLRALLSFSVWGFYLPQLVVITLLIIYM